MRVGFTGTRHGMTRSQFAAFAGVFPASCTLFRHGCCVGADERAALWVYGLPTRPTSPTIFGHPSDLTSLTSEAALAACDDTTGTADPPLVRNRDIVEMCDMLIAAPAGMAEEQRSGTWATVRYARKVNRPLVIVWPNGTMTGSPEYVTGARPDPPRDRRTP